MKLLKSRPDLLLKIYIPGSLAFIVILLLNPKIWLIATHLIYFTPLLYFFLIIKKYRQAHIANFNDSTYYPLNSWLLLFWALQLLSFISFMGAHQAIQQLLTIPREQFFVQHYLPMLIAVLLLLPILSVVLGARQKKTIIQTTLAPLSCLQQHYRVTADSSLTIITNTATRQAGLACLGFSYVMLALYVNQYVLNLLGLSEPHPSALGLFIAASIFVLSQSSFGQRGIKILWIYRFAIGNLCGIWLLLSLGSIDLLWYLLQPLQALFNNNNFLQFWQHHQLYWIQHDLLQLLSWGYSMCLITLLAFLAARISAGHRVITVLLAGLLNPGLILLLISYYCMPALILKLAQQNYLPLLSLLILIVYLNSDDCKRFMLATFPGRSCQLQKPFPLLILKRLQLVLVLGSLAYFAGSLTIFSVILVLAGGYVIYILLPIYGLAFSKPR